jgi:hypothetical protein
MTVVLEQSADAFACRSLSRTPNQLGWATNRLLIPAKSIELAFTAAVLFVIPIARELEHGNPPLAGWAVAFASLPLVLTVDWLDKHRRQRRPSKLAT